MDINTGVRQIRSMIGDDEMDAAIGATRALLQEHQLEKAMVQLDLIEGSWNEVRDQQITGVLSVDEWLRLQNVSREKLMQLLLEISGEQHLIAPFAASDSRQTANKRFKDKLKNVLGIALFVPSAGAFFGQEWTVGCCFGLAGLITYLPSLQFIEKTIRYELLSWQKYALVIGALLLAGQIHSGGW